ncbi:MAG: tRNA lysidine(34) synthetase TilS [Desulfamplus sp.]|nr:tRNA lysidine(34) synthetase TilS [Desulfamplus sp.]
MKIDENRKNLVEIALKTIHNYSMIELNDSILIGVSGGADSVALLLLIKDFCIKELCISIPIGVAHINHLLRGKESDRDEDFVADIAQKYNLPCHTIRVNVAEFARAKKLSFEEAARDVRYSFYSEIADRYNYNKIALAHNSNDNAELVLMNLLRGGGIKGLSGIPPVRAILGKTIIRPLIEASRDAILDYLRDKNQEYIVDSSNSDMAYLRNRIRHSLIPHLQENYNPSVTESLNRLSKIITDENSWIEEKIEQLFNSVIIAPKDEIQNEVIIHKRAFIDNNKALAKRLIRRAIQEIKGDLRQITFNHIEDALKLINSKKGGKAIHLPDRVRIIKIKESVAFRKESKPLREIGNKIDVG